MITKELEVVSQRIQNDCVICAVANACGYSYEQVFNNLTPEMVTNVNMGLGLDMGEIKTLLSNLQIKMLKYQGTPIDSNYGLYLGGNRALLILDQGAEIRHMVAWDGFSVLESNRKYFGRYDLHRWGITVGGGSLSAIPIKTNRSHRKASLRKSTQNTTT